MDQPQVLGTIPRSTRGSTKERREESNQGTELRGTGGLSGQEGRTVRKSHADCPAKSGGLSACVRQTVRPEPRTVRKKPIEPPVATLGKTDRPPGTRGLSVPLLRIVRNLVQPNLKTKMDRKRSRSRTRRTRDEHCSRGPSATTSWTVRASRTEAKSARPQRSTPQLITGSPKR
jgi:hypothetical protein